MPFYYWAPVFSGFPRALAHSQRPFDFMDSLLYRALPNQTPSRALQGQATGTASGEKERDRKREGKKERGAFQLAGLNTTQIMLTHTLSYTQSVVLYSGRSCPPARVGQ